jgi:hypothetical protein
LGFASGDEKEAREARAIQTKAGLFLNRNVQKLANAHNILDERLHREPTRLPMIHSKQI